MTEPQTHSDPFDQFRTPAHLHRWLYGRSPIFVQTKTVERMCGVLWGPPQSEIDSPLKQRLAWERAERDIVERLTDNDPYAIRVRTEDGQVLWELPDVSRIDELITRCVIDGVDAALCMVGEEMMPPDEIEGAADFDAEDAR